MKEKEETTNQKPKPKPNRSRSVPITFYVYPAEQKKIRESALHAGLSVSEYLRQCAAGHEVKPMADPRIWEMCTGVGSLIEEFRHNGYAEWLDGIQDEMREIREFLGLPEDRQKEKLDERDELGAMMYGDDENMAG